MPLIYLQTLAICGTIRVKRNRVFNSNMGKLVNRYMFCLGNS